MKAVERQPAKLQAELLCGLLPGRHVRWKLAVEKNDAIALAPGQPEGDIDDALRGVGHNRNFTRTCRDERS